jgi:hypothetical protein
MDAPAREEKFDSKNSRQSIQPVHSFQVPADSFPIRTDASKLAGPYLRWIFSLPAQEGRAEGYSKVLFQVPVHRTAAA